MKCKYVGTGVFEGMCLGTKEVDFCVGNERCATFKPYTMTNADRTRAMSDEELAAWLARIANGDVYTDFCDNPARTVVCDNKCVGCIAEWLKQPVKDGDNE